MFLSGFLTVKPYTPISYCGSCNAVFIMYLHSVSKETRLRIKPNLQILD